MALSFATLHWLNLGFRRSLEGGLLFFALFTNNYYYIKVHCKEKNISKINYTSSEKKMWAVTKVT